MDNEQKNSLPEFDSKYIDELFSSERKKPKPEPSPAPKPAPAPKKADSPQPEEPEQLPSAPSENRANLLLLLVAVVMLITGFLLGRITAPTPSPDPGPSSPTDGTAPTPEGTTSDSMDIDPGIATDYVSMSTQELAQIAVQTPGLSGYGKIGSNKTLPVTEYAQLRRSYPVLAALESRTDAVEQLISITLSPDSNSPDAAQALIRFYVLYWGFELTGATQVAPDCQWCVKEDSYTRVYEYTEAPQIASLSSGNGILCEFQGFLLLLSGSPSGPFDHTNFWYRIEWVANNSDDLLASMPNPVLGFQSSASSAWVHWQPCDNGWFVYGYAPVKTDISFTIYPNGTRHEIELTVSPLPQTNADASAYAQYAIDQAETLRPLIALNPDKDLSDHPIVVALNKTSSRISALLNMLQAAMDSSDCTALTSLLSTSNFTKSSTQNDALSLLRGVSGSYMEPTNLSQPALSASGDECVLSYLHGYELGKKPEALKDIPVSEMNFWAYVPLTKGAKILSQPNWTLTVEGNGIVGAWPYYDSAGAVSGWIVAGKLQSAKSLKLRLLQGDKELGSTYFSPQLLSE